MTSIEYDWDYCHTCGLSAEEIQAGIAEAAASASEPPVPPPAAASSEPGSGPPPPTTPPATPPTAPPTASPTPSRSGTSGLPPGTPGMGLMDEPARTEVPAVMLGGSVPKGAIAAGAMMVVVLIAVLLIFGGSDREPADVATDVTAPPLGGMTFRPSEDDKPYVVPSDQPFPTAAAGWIVFSPDDKSFSVEMPKPPTNTKLYSFPVQGTETQTLLFNAQDANGGYSIGVAEVGEAADPEAMLEQFTVDYGEQIGARTKSARVAEHDGHAARDFVLDSARFQLNARAVSIGTRVYVLTAGGTDPTVYNWPRFRDSLTV